MVDANLDNWVEGKNESLQKKKKEAKANYKMWSNRLVLTVL